MTGKDQMSQMVKCGYIGISCIFAGDDWGKPSGGEPLWQKYSTMMSPTN